MPSNTSVRAKETQEEIQKYLGQWLISLLYLWDFHGFLIGRKADFVLSGQDSDMSQEGGGDKEE